MTTMMQATSEAPAGGTVVCKVCGQAHAQGAPLPAGTIARCTRCGSILAKRTPYSLHLTAAFALSALILYWPANLFPIMRMEMYGATTENTVWQGCVRLWDAGDYVIATIVFLASIVIPFLKLLGLFLLVAAAGLRVTRWKRPRTRMYRFIDAIGRWAMLDVFVLAILVSLVKLQGLATVVPGRGLLAFTAVAIFTILATESFDPQLIWKADSERAQTTTTPGQSAAPPRAALRGDAS
jgi:paraquat-inducible protein A